LANDPLRGCPLCGTPVSAVALGLRDYSWLGDALPGRIAPMDVDFLLEKNGRFLVLEFKPTGVPLGQGQRIALKHLVRKGFDVWVVRESQGRAWVSRHRLDEQGNEYTYTVMSRDNLASNVSEWLKEAGA
jgi:hypothetical protein